MTQPAACARCHVSQVPLPSAWSGQVCSPASKSFSLTIEARSR
ncbi:hypothetical protein BH20ACT2_BH20ACT2_02080 [soil metagenome]